MAVNISNKKYSILRTEEVNYQSKEFFANGNYTPDEGYTGFDFVKVSVPEPIFEEITVSPAITSQEIFPSEGKDGISKITVNPVTHSIDQNIQPGNIKKGVTILEVDGTLEFTTIDLTIDPSKRIQTFNPASYNKNGFNNITVNPVTSAIDDNIKANNIKSGVTILGVNGNVVALNGTTKNIYGNGIFRPENPYNGFTEVVVDVGAEITPLEVTPTTSDQIFTPVDEYSAFAPVTVKGVTAGIDNNIIPANIKQGVSILGVEGTLNSVKGYTLTVDPSTSSQSLTPTGNYNAFTKVNVNPVTASIDEDIVASNIKQGVNILGVNGSVIELKGRAVTLNPTTSQQVIPPYSGYNAFTEITINPVTSAIDDDIAPENIKLGKNILGVNGSVIELKGKSLNIVPQTYSQSITPSGSYNAFTSISVEAVEADIDYNIQPSNILEGVTILGVTGEVIELNGESITISPMITEQTITPSEDKNAITEIIVEPVTSDIDANIVAGNIKTGVTILGVNGSCIELKGQVKSVTPAITEQEITPDAGYNALTKVIVESVTSSIDPDIQPENILSGVNILGVTGSVTELHGDTLTINPSTSSQSFTPVAPKNGFTSVTANPVTAAIDPDIIATNIKSGVNILGVNGSVIELNGQTKHIVDNGTYTPTSPYNGFTEITVDVDTVNNDTLTINPSTSTQTFNAVLPITGFNGITVNPVTAAIDPDIVATNIKSGVNILGVNGSVVELVPEIIRITDAGTYTPITGNGFTEVEVDITAVNNDTLTINPSTSIQSFNAPAPYTGYNGITVNPVTSAIDTNISAGNILDGVTILGVIGNVTQLKGETRTETITSTAGSTFTPSTGKNGITSITVSLNNQAKTINPSTSAQTINVPSGYSGFGTLTVNAVDENIDANIQASNILSGVTILGVTGEVVELKGETRAESITATAGNTFTPNAGKNGITSITVTPTNQAKTINPSTSSQTINVPSGYSGFGTLTVNPVTDAIDANIQPENILDGVTILGVTGTVTELHGETRTENITSTSGNTFTPATGKNGITSITVSPTNKALTVNATTSSQSITVPSGYSGYGTVTVNPVTAAIDSDIKASNILSGVNILGVTGSVTELHGTTLTATATTSEQTFTPSGSYNGYTSVTIKPVTAAIDADITPTNIKSGVNILGVNGSVIELNGETRNVSITATAGNTFTPTSGKNAITSITVAPTNKAITVTPTASQQTITVPSGYSGHGTVTVNGAALQSKTLTVDANTSTVTTLTPDGANIGLSSVTVDLSWILDELEDLNAGDSEQSINLEDITVSTAGSYTHSAGYDGLGTVTVDLSWVETAIEQAAQGACDGTADMLIEDSAINIATDADRVNKYAFYYREHLKKVVLNNATSIGEYAFANSDLEILVINTNTVCSLADVNAFTTTPDIYVTDSLVASYKAATNWSSFSANIHSVNDL